VIASKNVSLVAGSLEDVDLYKGVRFSFAALMAQCWFNLISVLKKKELDSLKADMNGRTWVGEYIGNIQCQHLVKYPKESIIFYAIVDNESSKICKLTEDSYKLFKKYGFDVVALQSLGVYSDYDKLCDDIEKEFRLVAA
jgi:tRNA splicing ligase